MSQRPTSHHQNQYGCVMMCDLDRGYLDASKTACFYIRRTEEYKFHAILDKTCFKWNKTSEFTEFQVESNFKLFTQVAELVAKFPCHQVWSHRWFPRGEDYFCRSNCGCREDSTTTTQLSFPIMKFQVSIGKICQLINTFMWWFVHVFPCLLFGSLRISRIHATHPGKMST